MENEIMSASSVSKINAVLKNHAGQYDLDILMLSKAGLGVNAEKGLLSMPLVGENGTVHEYTGKDVYSVSSSDKELAEIKELVIKSIKYRD